VGRSPLVISQNARNQFHMCGDGLSVTDDAPARDNIRERRRADTQSKMPAAVKPQNFSYGVIFQTTPSLFWPAKKFVPYRLPFASKIGLP
jgi:hypothetical protein